ncbi:MAG: InlB B-repeat-containing protein [Ruminococcus sp.]|nr:InlB B-repeat-containing protein [Ruminococcus sp.]
MKKVRFIGLFLVICLLLSSFSTGFVGASQVVVDEVGAEIETAETSANLYGLADNIQQGQILQCWNWSYRNIEANLQKIAEQGFSAIQTSPIQPIKEQTTEYWNTVMNSSWVIYQPVAFNIEDNYRNVQGTKTEFKSMCAAAHKYGIKVICDVVFNHMANDMSNNTIHPWVPSDIKDNPDCWHDISKNISNFDNRYDVTQYCLTGLPDLNTAHPTVQWHCTNLLKEAIEAGADGFRFDAAKHIETPSDSSSYRSDFWPNVLGAATEYAQSTRGFTPYYYGEVLGSPGGSLSISAYTKYMCVTDPGSSDSIRDGVCNGDASKAATGNVSCGAAKDRAVQWTESHDNHKDNGTRFLSDEQINKTWAMVGAKSQICGVYLARPENMDTTMMGDADQTSWTSSSVKAVNRFNNAFVGQSEYLSSYNSLACIERGNSGMIIVNTGGSYYNGISVPVHTMSSGTYKDAITGNTFTVSGGRISGDIGDKGIAVVYNVDANGPFSYGNLTDFAVTGSFNDWDTGANKMVATSANKATTSMYLSAGTYAFKVTANGLWYGNSGTIENTTGESGWTMKTSKDDNCTLVATGGKYNFTFDITTGKLVVEHVSTTSRDSDYYLKGSFNSWEGVPMTFDEGTNTVSANVQLSAGTHTFKINNTRVGSWYSNAGTISNETGEGGWTMSVSVDNNCALTAEGGTYRFTFNPSTMRLVVEQTADLSGKVRYTVTFVNYDGSILSVQQVEEGTSATAPTAPTRPTTAKHTYTFSGWDTDFTKVTSDITVTATYTQTVNKYTVTFLDWDGSVISTQQVEYGSAATVPPVVPEREGYIFTGWDQEFSSVTQNLTVTAQYTNSATYLKGSFNGWTEDNPMVFSGTSNVVTATLTLDPGTYTFKIHSQDKWYGNNGTIEDTTTATSSIGWKFKTGTENCTLVATGGTYEFNFNLSTNYVEILRVTKEYTVTFEDYDGTVLSTQKVEAGKAATAPATPTREATDQYTYTFKEWDKDFSKITADITVTAVYTETINKYTVTFKNWDNTVLSTQQVEYGKGATAPEKPTRAADAQYTYTFARWNTSFSTVRRDMTVIAVYTQTLNKYSVTFNDFDGTQLSTQQVEYGTAATAPEAPTREGYTFKEWDKDFSNITGDTVITAVYTKNPVVSEPTGTLRIRVAGGTGFTISIDGGAARPQGATYLNSKIPVGAEVTVSALSSSNARFIGWVNPITGSMLSDEVSCTFTASGNDFLNAVYSTQVEGVQLLTFLNDKAGTYGRILDSQYYSASEQLAFPADPTQIGFDFAGWSMTEEEIKSAIANGEDVTVVATWTKAIVPVEVTVIGGTGSGTYNANNAVTVTANAAEAGEKFAYWTDTQGNIRSYNPEYTFFPSADTTVTAVFVDEDTEIDYQILVSLDSIDTTSIADKNVFTYSWYCPDSYSFVKAGIVAVNKDNYNEATFVAGSSDSNVYDRSPSGTNLIPVNTYTWSKSNVASGQTWMAKAYVQYRDASGQIVTVYSDTAEATKD